jgi:predicted negative regulator of RcsB-dependent stress response
MCSPAQTFRWATTYLALASKSQQLSETYQALRYFGDIFLAIGNEQTALNIFQAVLDGSTEMDVHRRRADCMSRIGDILLRRQEVERATEMWEAARPLFVRSSRANDVVATDAKLEELARTNTEDDPKGSSTNPFSPTN